MHDPSLTQLLPRLLLSMVAVIGAMALIARLLGNRKIPGTGGLRLGSVAASKKRAAFEVISRHSIGRHASVALVRAGDTTLVIGVTDQNVSLLTQLDEIALVESEIDAQGTDVDVDAAITTAAPSPAWTGLLTQVRERTVRR